MLWSLPSKWGPSRRGAPPVWWSSAAASRTAETRTRSQAPPRARSPASETVVQPWLVSGDRSVRPRSHPILLREICPQSSVILILATLTTSFTPAALEFLNRSILTPIPFPQRSPLLTIMAIIKYRSEVAIRKYRCQNRGPLKSILTARSGINPVQVTGQVSRNTQPSKF